MIAALFVETNGVYFGLPEVDPWDITRDARKYAGPDRVIAHPPCQLWTNLAHVNFKRYGGEHNRPGSDEGCFEHALACVRTFGGVLEHPAGSHAWARFNLTKPTPLGWTQHGNQYVVEVAQSAYGCLARKRTWLYYIGPRPPELDLRQPEGTHQIGWFDRKKPTLSKKAASRTPIPFRDLLISLANL